MVKLIEPSAKKADDAHHLAQVSVGSPVFLSGSSGTSASEGCQVLRMPQPIMNGVKGSLEGLWKRFSTKCSVWMH
jgi:hypothetical protein